jgi:hypothetical protein
MEGFFGKKLYAANPASMLTIKLAMERWRECSIWQIFFNSSLIVSMMERLRYNFVGVRHFKLAMMYAIDKEHFKGFFPEYFF